MLARCARSFCYFVACCCWFVFFVCLLQSKTLIIFERSRLNHKINYIACLDELFLLLIMLRQAMRGAMDYLSYWLHNFSRISSISLFLNFTSFFVCFFFSLFSSHVHDEKSILTFYFSKESALSCNFFSNKKFLLIEKNSSASRNQF